MMLPKQNKISQLFRSFPLIDAILYLIKRSTEVFSSGNIRIHKYRIYSQEVEKESPSKKKSAFTFKILSRYSRSDVSQFPRPVKALKFRFDQDGKCILAKKGDDFVGYIWINIGQYVEDEVNCRYILDPHDKSCWDYDVYIAPKYRFSLAFKRLWYHTFKFLDKKGVDKSYSRIDAFNLNSIHVHERLGSVYCGFLFCFVFGSFQLFISNFKPYFGISVYKNKVFDVYIKRKK